MSVSGTLTSRIRYRRTPWSLRRRLLTQGVSIFVGGGTLFSGASPSFADIVPDTSVGSQVLDPISSPILHGANCISIPTSCTPIRGGELRGDNLFHSFSQFTISPGENVYLGTPPGASPLALPLQHGNAENIFIRVVGSPTDIDGNLSVSPDFINSPNVFFLSPQGITVGPNARLVYPGNFLFSTARQLYFGGGAFFNAASNTPLLTLSGFENSPSILLFENAPGSINFNSPAGFDNIGISPTPHQFAVVGGAIDFHNVEILTEGSLHVGAVGDSQTVGLNFSGSDIDFDYSSVSNFKDITLDNSQLFTRSLSGVNDAGDIEIVGNSLTSNNDAKVISGFNNPAAGSIDVDLKNNLTLNGGSEIATVSDAGDVGDINITANDLSLNNQGFILSRAHDDGGDLNINLTGNASLNTNSFILLEMTDSSVNSSGELVITGQDLSLDGDSRILNRTPDDGGNLSLLFENDIVLNNSSQTGTFLTKNGRDVLQGDAGNIEIEAQNLTLINSSEILAQTAGEKGNIVLDLSGDLSVIGNTLNRSQIIAQLETPMSPAAPVGAAGDISITANNVLFENGLLFSATDQPGGSINVNAANTIQLDQSEIRLSSNTGAGHTGNLNLTAQSTVAPTAILLTDTRILNEATNTGGDVTFSTPGEVELRDGSFISMDSSGTGGNLTVSASAFRSNDISANNDVLLNQGTLSNLSLPADVTGFDLLASQVDLTNGTSELLPTPSLALPDSPPEENPPSPSGTPPPAVDPPTVDPPAVDPSIPSPTETPASEPDAEDGNSEIINQSATLAEGFTRQTDNTENDDNATIVLSQFYGDASSGLEPTRRCLTGKGRLRVSGRGGIGSMPSSLGGNSSTLEDLGMINASQGLSASIAAPDVQATSLSPTQTWVEAGAWQRNSQGKIILLAQSQSSLSLAQKEQCQSIHEGSG